MMSLNRWFLLLMLSGGVAACAPTDSGSANEALGKKQQAIWDGGSTTTNPSGMNGGVVKLEVSGGTKSPMGTGMALNNRWVLTAQHVRGLHQYGAVKATPFGATSSYVAKAGWVVNAGPWAQGGGTTPAYDLEVVKFDPMLLNGTTSGFKTPIFHGSSSSTITNDIVALGTVDCVGFGDGGPAGPAGELRWAMLPVTGGSYQVTFPNDANTYTLGPPANFFTLPNSGGQQLSQGDSGGPCFEPSGWTLAGIMRNAKKETPPTPQNPSSLGVVTSVGAYSASGPTNLFNLDRQLQQLVDKDPEFAFFGDIDGDKNPDLIMVVAKNDGAQTYFDLQAQLTGTPLPNGFVDFYDANLLGVAMPAVNLDSTLAALGDYNGDGVGDMLALFGGQSFYFDGRAALVPTAHVPSPECLVHPLDPAYCPIFDTAYMELRSVDLDGDKFTDLEAIDASGEVDVFSGSVYGLKPARRMQGFPSADGNDGRFVTVTGAGNATVAHASMGLWVAVHPSQQQFALEVFDGGMEGSDDVSGSPDDNTCFALYKAPGQVKGALVKQWDKSFFTGANNAWKSLGSFTTSVPQGESYDWYLLEVKLGTGGCNSLGPAAASINPFKVRMTLGTDPAGAEGLLVEGNGSDPSEPLGQISFRGVDSYGPSTPDGAFGDDVPDTTYDGTFQFLIYAGDNPTGITVTEADADYSLDGQTGACSGYSDPITQDAQIPGVAVGANQYTSYSLLWWNGSSWETEQKVCDPSGQYTPGTEETEERHFQIPPGGAAWWSWAWDSIWVHNNVLVFPVTASPAPYAVFGKRPPVGQRAPIGASRTVEYWSNASSEIVSKLPIVLGTTNAAVNVTTTSQAAAILAGLLGPGSSSGEKLTVCHKEKAITIDKHALPAHLAHGDDTTRPQAMAALLAQLLAAKLNVQRCDGFGQDLASAFLYGREETVAQVLAQSDSAVLLTDEMCALTATDVAKIKDLSALLGMVNKGSLSRIPRNPRAVQVFRPVLKPIPLHLLPLSATPVQEPPNWPLIGD